MGVSPTARREWRRARATPTAGRRSSPTMDAMSEPTRRILLAKPRAYCAGVDPAVQAVELALERYGPPLDVRDSAKLAWLSQTTLSVDETTQTVAALRERFPLLIDPPSDDICYATQNRQAAVKQIAKESDLVIVVGSTNSSNSVRLVEVALDAGASNAYLVDDAAAIDQAWLESATTLGVTSGASVPEELVSQVLDRLAEAGFSTIEEVEAVRESMSFALPRDLRSPRR